MATSRYQRDGETPSLVEKLFLSHKYLLWIKQAVLHKFWGIVSYFYHKDICAWISNLIQTSGAKPSFILGLTPGVVAKPESLFHQTYLALCPFQMEPSHLLQSAVT